MFFRFAAVLVILLAVALAGVAVEKGNLSLRRAISLQEYRRLQLVEQRARLRVRVERLMASMRTADERLAPRTASADAIDR